MSNQFYDSRIDDDLALLSETLEEVLRSQATLLTRNILS
jgi:ElaB protein